MDFNNTVTVTINGEVVENIAPGLPTIDALDETLDSGTLIIAPTKRRDRYPVYSEVFITTVSNGVTETKYFYVSEDGVDTVCKDPVLYSHTVQLIEPTKRLEGIPCDNLTFVKPSAANSYPTALNGNATIYDVVMRIRECAQLRTENSTRKYPFELTDAVTIAYLKSITAPQFFLNAGNVKDALNQVFKYINGTARLKTFTELTVDFFNDYKDIITTDGAQDYAESQSIENYSTALISNIANATGDVGDRQSLVNFPSPKNWLTFRPQRDEGILTTDNSVCKTPSPIYQITGMKLWVPIVDNDEKRSNFVMDIAPFIVEKFVFDALPAKTEYRIKLVDPSVGYAYVITKRGQDSCLVYDYMGTEIYGIFNNYRAGILYTYPALDFIIGYLYSQEHPFNGVLPVKPWEYAQIQGGRFGDVAYQIDYITTVDTRAEVQRLDLTDFKVYSTQQINQASNLVNTTAFGDSMRGLIERLGNPEKIATKLFRYNSDVPKIGDYTEDGYVVTTLQRSLYNDYIIAVLGMTKNFNRRSQFVDVDSEVRQYVIPAVGESLTRHSNYGEFIYLDIGENTQIQDDANSIVQPGAILPLIIQFISQTFSADFAVNPNLANLIFYDKKNVSAISNILASVYSQGFANSLVFSFGFNDNRSAGTSTSAKYIVDERQVAQVISYTDEDGAAAYLDIRLVNHWMDDGAFNTASTLGRQFPTWTSAMDITDMASISTVNRFKLFKSSAEISKFTIQLHYLPLPQYASKMILGEGLTTESSLTQTYPAGMTRNIAVYTVNDRFQKWENKFVRGTKIGNITEGSTADGGRVNLPNIPAGKSWCIGNEDTKSLYLAYNPEPNEAPPKTIRFVRKINRI